MAREMHRRAFLKGGTTALVTIGVAPWWLARAGAASGPGAFGKAEFEALLHAWFHIGSPEGGWHAVELVAVRDDGSSALAEQWSVVFRGAPGLELPEGTHRVAPPDADPFDLFLQPTGDDGQGPTYVARYSVLRTLSPSCAAA